MLENVQNYFKVGKNGKMVLAINASTKESGVLALSNK